MPDPSERRTLYLVDGSNLVYRAYHALPPLTNSRGEATHAVLGFTQMFRKLLEQEAPDLLAVAFDPEAPGFRKAIYPAYKDNRADTPEDLVGQLALARAVVEAFGAPVLMPPEVEADDVIATLADRGVAAGLDVVIVSSDKDLMQLVGERCVMLDTMKRVRFGPAEVTARHGVRPDQITDMLALMGDSSDNIPGVPGVGPKTAAALLADYGDLDGVYAHADAITGKRGERLRANRDDAYLSRRLAALVRDVDVGLELDELARRDPDRAALAEIFARLEFKALQRAFAGPPPTRAPAAIAAGAFTIVRDAAALDAMAEAARASELLAVALVRSDDRPMRDALIGIALAPSRESAAYIPVAHHSLDAGAQLSAEAALAALGPALSDPDRPVAIYDTKAASQLLARHGVHLRGVTADPMLMGYLLNAGRYEQTLENLADTWLDHRKTRYEDIGGKGAKRRAVASLPVDTVAAYAAEAALLTLTLGEVLGGRLVAEHLDGLYRDIELPLAQVLADMERTGVLVDVAALEAHAHELGERARALEAHAHEAAGREFALGSPSQLAEVLFGDLSLPPGKKTKTGYSTDSGVLESLRHAHPLPAIALEWRQLTKLKSTYADTLPTLVHPETGRIHTVFNQAVAATGRLSSEAPNLQNIPIRTEEGRRIRTAFIAAEGHVLVSADYSQIELRLLAHMSGDERMRETFIEGVDVHRRTAAEILDLPLDAVTRDERGMAKAINFGILYGMSAFRLAKELDISRPEAERFIERYYARFPKVRAWKAEVLERARDSGVVTTLLGRIRRVGDLRARHQRVRAAAERIAINTPVQGTAADLIKRAMVRVHARLARELPAAKLLLQVHDELVFEVPEADADALVDAATAEMRGVIDLAVPLEVNAARGRNWLEAH